MADAHSRPGLRRSRGRTVAALATIGALVLGGIVGGSWALTNRSGSDDAESAVATLLDRLIAFDAVGAVDALAPSEVDIASEFIDGIGGRLRSEKYRSLSDFLRTPPPHEGVAVRSEGLVLEPTTVADGVVRVGIGGGRVTFNGDPVAVTDTINAFRGAFAYAHASVFACPDGAEKVCAEAARYDRPLRTPVTIDLAATNLAVIAVEEHGRWYVSPLLSAAERFLTDGWYAPHEVPRDGVIAAADGASSSTEAGTRYLAGLRAFVHQGDPSALASISVLPERRLWSVYGRALAGVWQRTADPDLTVDPLGTFTAEERDGRTLLVPAGIRFSTPTESFVVGRECVSRTALGASTGPTTKCLPAVSATGALDGSFLALETVSTRDGWLIGALPLIRYEGANP
ncbi:hypothetical protein F8O01_05210 [Pseudoclavibacter chungangensis]|uniref:Uncharacterized protein n=1 Tax=Pseudoclavibacter chungangensis TaxID=587635 RepID=A0A7J5BZ69_9MICO|nr:hypothetical protein [Pseudoclavibacter chungangensis]KAB1659658.1 hypothetical protein F8O01_05210 [Pseudoclavibacter chungangensis]NYJ67495.1 hypothetical protein [Pseudoclavibacter chungangensis]